MERREFVVTAAAATAAMGIVSGAYAQGAAVPWPHWQPSIQTTFPRSQRQWQTSASLASTSARNSPPSPSAKPAPMRARRARANAKRFPPDR